MRITTAFLRDVLDAYHRGEISFSRMVEMINEEAKREEELTDEQFDELMDGYTV